LTHWGTGRGATSCASAATRPQLSASRDRMELVAFLRLSDTAEREPPLPYWVRHSQHFPSLFILAVSFLGAVGSSSSCERAFSFTGALVREERASLSVDSVEMHSLVAASIGIVPTKSSAVPRLTRAQARAFRDRMNSFVLEEEGGVNGVHEWSSGESTPPSDGESYRLRSIIRLSSFLYTTFLEACSQRCCGAMCQLGATLSQQKARKRGPPKRHTPLLRCACPRARMSPYACCSWYYCPSRA